MNLEKVVFGFFVLLALTLNFSFVVGDMDNPDHHHVFELYAAIVVSVIATVLKFGDRTQMGAVLLATSLVADLHLIAAAVTWGYTTQVSGTIDDPGGMATVVSLAGGALLANLVSVVMLVIETVSVRR